MTSRPLDAEETWQLRGIAQEELRGRLHALNFAIRQCLMPAQDLQVFFEDLGKAVKSPAGYDIGQWIADRLEGSEDLDRRIQRRLEEARHDVEETREERDAAAMGLLTDLWGVLVTALEEGTVSTGVKERAVEVRKAVKDEYPDIKLDMGGLL